MTAIDSVGREKDSFRDKHKVDCDGAQWPRWLEHQTLKSMNIGEVARIPIAAA